MIQYVRCKLDVLPTVKHSISKPHCHLLCYFGTKHSIKKSHFKSKEQFFKQFSNLSLASDQESQAPKHTIGLNWICFLSNEITFILFLLNCC